MSAITDAKTQKTLDDIIAYYDETRWDYGLLWFKRNYPSVHFGFYDETARCHADALINLNRVLADTAGIAPGARVLDAGCGQGGSSVWLAEHRGAEVVGITPVPGQVCAARKFAARKGMTAKVRFKQGDYTATGFPDEQFDVVWACESLCHADRKELFYREAYRVLKPGGRLIVAEYVRAAEHADAERLLKAWLNGWSINWIDSEAEHLAHARSAGFRSVHVRDVTRHTEPSLRLLHRLSVILRPLEYSLHFLRVRTPVQHGNIVGSIRQYEALQKGYWRYGIISAEK